jgi:hypothetical protein
MPAERLELQAVLTEYARQRLADLATRYGMQCIDIPNGILLRSRRAELRVILGSGHLPDVNVLISPPGGREHPLGLGVVLDELADPSVAFAPRPISSGQEIKQEIDRAAGLIEKFGDKYLSGDFTSWPTLHARSAQMAREYARGGVSQRVWIERQEGEVAFGRGNYAEAAEHLGAIEAHLTDLERRKLAYAREQLRHSGRD